MKEETGIAAGPDGKTLPRQLEFLRLFWAVSHALQSRSKSMQQRLGVSGPQRLAIRIIGHHPGLTAGDLARHLCIHPSTLTGILQRLERRGLITSTPAPRDRRRRHLQLTAEGQRFNQPQAGTIEEIIRPLVDELEPHDREVLVRVLGAMSVALSADDATHDPGRGTGR